LRLLSAQVDALHAQDPVEEAAAPGAQPVGLRTRPPFPCIRTAPRTQRSRPRSTPNEGWEYGHHLRPDKRLGFYPTPLAHFIALSRVIGTHTHLQTLCDPAAGPTRRVADVLRVLKPSRIFLYDGLPSSSTSDEPLPRSYLNDSLWCRKHLSTMYTIVTSLPYRHQDKTLFLQNLLSLLSLPGSNTHCVAVKLFTAYDGCRKDNRNILMQQASFEIKLPPTVYPTYKLPLPWSESWFVFLRHPMATSLGTRLVSYGIA